mmetsp:Transcript_66322/g.178525  ORF Transcript_66322/g.178525 Transcript_66322/m.178525 type:complete len:229 (-) Transcript_66322:395-1081(-)
MSTNFLKQYNSGAVIASPAPSCHVPSIRALQRLTPILFIFISLRSRSPDIRADGMLLVSSLSPARAPWDLDTRPRWRKALGPPGYDNLKGGGRDDDVDQFPQAHAFIHWLEGQLSGGHRKLLHSVISEDGLRRALRYDRRPRQRLSGAAGGHPNCRVAPLRRRDVGGAAGRVLLDRRHDVQERCRGSEEPAVGQGLPQYPVEVPAGGGLAGRQHAAQAVPSGPRRARS